MMPTLENDLEKQLTEIQSADTGLTDREIEFIDKIDHYRCARISPRQAAYIRWINGRLHERGHL